MIDLDPTQRVAIALLARTETDNPHAGDTAKLIARVLGSPRNWDLLPTLLELLGDQLADVGEHLTAEIAHHYSRTL